MANRKKEVYKPKPMTEGKETSSMVCCGSMTFKRRRTSKTP